MNKKGRNKRDKSKITVRTFKKSLVSYVLMLLFFAFLFLRTGMPSFVFIIIAIPMTISIIHKYIDAYSNEDDTFHSDQHIDLKEDLFEEEDLDERPLDLEEFKSLRKEWKDSDFV